MEFNYALERRKFEKQWKLLWKQYREAGMDEDAIKQIYEFDLQWFNSERRYIRRQADLPEDVTVYDLADSDTEIHVGEVLPSSGPLHVSPVDRLWWINEIDNKDLLCKLKQLSNADIELLTALVFEGKTQRQLAQECGCSQKTISNYLYKIKIFLK